MPYPSNIHIHHLKCVYIHNDMQCQSRQCNSDPFPHLFFLLSERLNIDRHSIVPANVKHASWINKPLAACHQDLCHSEECSPQRGAQARRGGIQYAHSSECSIKRGCRAHQQSTLLYGTQTERGCWSQYTPGYQAEPITTDRYIIPLDSPIWRVRYIYRT